MAYRPPSDRKADVDEARRLRMTGMTISAIANAMGVARTTASQWLNHPETGKLYRQRQRQYQYCSCGRLKSYGAKQCKKCRYQ